MRFSPEQAAISARQVDALYYGLTLLTVVVLAVVFLPMLFFLFRYRRGHRANRRPATLPMLKIEVTWTVVPLLLSLAIFGWGARVYYDLEVPPAGTQEMNVVGRQWMWKVQHPEGRREINELHVAVGRRTKLTLASQDVIHSFFVPAFRLKQDVVPGRFTTLWFEATRVGTYHLFCAEFCGTDHSRMIGTVYVMEPTAYQEWLTLGGGGDTLAQTGARHFRALGCSGCHIGQGPIRAPRLEGLFGRQVPLQDGRFILADDRYLRDSILLPANEVTAGYEPLMPAYAGRISEEELLELIAYLKSLPAQAPAAFR